ncbi:MAG TPA: hypothetical protein VEF04_03590 [Blastocatellia bacterium]|nr:hypothetical protein [Blastocatellia bacterium]
MAINPIKPQGGSKLLSAGIGFLTGGPAGAAMALAPDSAGKGLLGLASKLPKAEPEMPDMTQANAISQAPAFGTQALPASNPIESKLKSFEQDPKFMTNKALALMKDPSIPQDIRDQYAEPLLRMKHYGRIG